jgi:hypothetical protein
VTGKGFKPGPDARRGKGPKKGAPNAGRPRKDYLNWCERVLTDPDVDAAVLTILRNPKHPQFASLYGKLAERAYGRPAGSEVTFPIDPRQLTDEQLQRIAQGEDPLLVLATTQAEPSPAPNG